MAGRLVFTDCPRHGGFEGRYRLALAAGHFYSYGFRGRAVLVHIEDEAGGAGVVRFDGRRRRRLCHFGGDVGRWWCLGSIFGIRLFGATAAEPAGPRAAGQQD